MSKVLFKQLSEDSDNVKFISIRKLHHYDVEVKLIIKVENTKSWGDDPQYPYHVELHVVSPDCVGEDKKESVRKSWGFESIKEVDAYRNSFDVWCELLDVDGIFAKVWQRGGNNLEKLMKEARREAELCDDNLESYLSKTQNAMGTPGFKAIRGEL